MSFIEEYDNCGTCERSVEVEQGEQGRSPQKDAGLLLGCPHQIGDDDGRNTR